MHTNIFSEIIVTGILQICRVNFSSYSDSGTGGKINRPYAALYLKIQGRTTYTNASGVYLSDPDHIVFLPKGCSYQVKFEELGECYLVEFDTEQVSGDILSIPLENRDTLVHHLTRLENLWLFRRPSYLPRAMAELYGMLTRLDELTNSAYIPSEKFRLIRPAMDYLEAHYDDPGLRVEQLSSLAGVSEAYFRRLFHEVYHVSSVQYLRSVRVSRAKGLLSGKYASMEEVARQAGFSSVYHFSKTFRLLTGQTPSSFAASRRAGAIEKNNAAKE